MNGSHRGAKALALLVTIASLAVGAATVAAVTASPASAACTSGDVCYWGEDDWRGCYYSTPNDDSNLSNNYWTNCYPARVSNGPNSIANVANWCTVAVFDLTYYGGGRYYFSRVGLGGTGWYDFNLGNNYWISGSGIVENDISSHDFCH